jgi:ribosome-binding factor A
MLRDALSSMFQRSLPEYLDGMVTVVSVKMSPDLRVAKIYVSIYRSTTDPDLQIKRLTTHAPEIRKNLAGMVSMKFMPELRFYRDDTLDAAERIDKLLQAVRREDEAKGLRHDNDNGDEAGSRDEDGADD